MTNPNDPSRWHSTAPVNPGYYNAPPPGQGPPPGKAKPSRVWWIVTGVIAVVAVLAIGGLVAMAVNNMSDPVVADRAGDTTAGTAPTANPAQRAAEQGMVATFTVSPATVDQDVEKARQYYTGLAASAVRVVQSGLVLAVRTTQLTQTATVVSTTTTSQTATEASFVITLKLTSTTSLVPTAQVSTSRANTHVVKQGDRWLIDSFTVNS